MIKAVIFVRIFFCFNVWTKLIWQNYWKIKFQNRTKKCLNTVKNYSLVVPSIAFRPLFIHLNFQKEYYFFKIWRICILYSLISKVTNNRKSQVSPFSFQIVFLRVIYNVDWQKAYSKKERNCRKIRTEWKLWKNESNQQQNYQVCLECDSIMKLLWLTQISFII